MITQLLLVILITLPSAWAEEKAHGLVQVASDFVDLSGGGRERVSGTGSLISFKAGVSDAYRYFVLTSAHVSQGENLKIKLGRNWARIKEDGRARLSNNTFDVEWIEIERPDDGELPLAEMAIPCRGGGFADWFNVTRWPEMNSTHCLLASQDQIRPWRSRDPVNANSDDGSRNSMDASDNSTGAFVLVPSWTSAQRSLDESLGKFQRENVLSPDRFSYRNYMGFMENGFGEYTIFMRVRPGMSGGPLLIPQSDDGTRSFRLSGIVKDYDRRFYNSTVVSEAKILETFRQYIAGRRGHVDGTKLVRENGLSYRRYSNGITGVFVDRSVVGNGERNDGGNGERNDGGNGERNDGGNSGRTAVDSYRSHGLRPGLGLGTDGATINIIALKPPRGTPLPQEYLFANEEAAITSLNYDLRTFELLRFGDPVVPLLYGKQPLANRVSPPRRVGLRATPITDEHFTRAELRFNGDGAVLRLEIRGQRRDTLELHFDSSGRCLESGLEGFRPVFSVKSRRRKDYWVDVRRFFFTDLGYLSASSLDIPTARPPVVVVRDATERTEYELEFSQPFSVQ